MPKKDGQQVQNPIFPNIEVAQATNQKGVTGIVLTIIDTDAEQIEAILSPKYAVHVAKEIMSAALTALDLDDGDEIEGVSILRFGDDEGRAN